MKVFLIIVLSISTTAFGFEANEEYEEEKRNQEAEQDSKQIKRESNQKRNQNYEQQSQQNFLIRKSRDKPQFLQKENEEIN